MRPSWPPRVILPAGGVPFGPICGLLSSRLCRACTAAGFYQPTRSPSVARNYICEPCGCLITFAGVAGPWRVPHDIQPERGKGQSTHTTKPTKTTQASYVSRRPSQSVYGYHQQMSVCVRYIVGPSAEIAGLIVGTYGRLNSPTPFVGVAVWVLCPFPHSFGWCHLGTTRQPCGVREKITFAGYKCGANSRNGIAALWRLSFGGRVGVSIFPTGS